MKGRDMLALAADRLLPRRRRACLANGEMSLADGLARTVDRALGDAALASAFASLEAQVVAVGFAALREATPLSDCRALFQITAALAPARALEIGTHIGASTLHIAAGLRQSGGGRLTTVDIADVDAPDGPWSRVGACAPPSVVLARLGLADRVTFVQSRSGRFLAGASEQYDLVFIDGSHSEVPAYLDIRNALGRLAPGGLILLHDYHGEGAGNPGVRRAVDRLCRDAPFLDVLPLGALPWAASTSLAAIVRAPLPASRHEAHQEALL
jgi:predicted O-methyltransferase YrrM